MDLYPTLTELAGLPAEAGAQGRSLVTLLDNPQSPPPRADAFIQAGSGFGLRRGKWAWMWYPATRKHEQEGFMLYDLENDPEQYTNLASEPEFASIRMRLHKRLKQRIKAAEK